MPPIRFVRFGIEGSQCRKSLLDLATQGSKRMRFLLPELVMRTAILGLRNVTMWGRWCRSPHG